MKIRIHILLTGLAIIGASFLMEKNAQAAVPVNEENFPDASIRAYVKSIDLDGDGKLSEEEIGKVTYFDWMLLDPINRHPYGSKPGDTVDFTGMQNFTHIVTVSLWNVGNLKTEWNYADSNLFQYFPYAKQLTLNEGILEVKGGQGEISLTGSSDYLERMNISGYDIENKTIIKKWDFKAKNLKYLDIKNCDFMESGILMDGFPSLKELKVDRSLLPGTGISLKGLSSLEYADLSGVEMEKLDLYPVRKTLKTLILGPCVENEDLDDYDEGCQRLKTLDISQMERMEKLWAGHTGIQKVITKDKNGKSKTKNLKKICLSNSKIQSVDVTAMPNLKVLCLYNTQLSNLNVTKNTQLSSLWVGSPGIKSINVSKNKKLDTFVLKGDLKTLDLSKNTLLRALRLGSYSKKARIKTLTLPMVNKSLKWHKFGALSEGYSNASGYVHKVSNLDLSKITKLSQNTKNYQMMMINKERGLKKIIISKKLKTADRNFIKKKAKAAKAKVVVR